jgi:hypothetical protein
LIAACPYSFHDLSRVRLDKGTPRFNMPFELGLAVATAHWRPAHQWFLFEAKPFRVQRTLSDLGGTDAYIHAESSRGLLIALTRLTYADLFGTLEDASAHLGRKVAPTIYSPRELARRRKQDSAFVTRVLEQPKLWLIGDEGALAA